MGKHLYCPICGTTNSSDNIRCKHCRRTVVLVPSKYDAEYYRQKSLENYGDYYHWREYLDEEVKLNPLYDEEVVKEADSPEFREKVREEDKKKRDERLDRSIALMLAEKQASLPKCPLCNSTNLKKISGMRKALHAYAFGLFSNTAKSQFECGNCGYKF